MQTSSAKLEHRLVNVMLVDLVDPTQPMELICDDYSSVEIQEVVEKPRIPRIPLEALITLKFVREASTTPFERVDSDDVASDPYASVEIEISAVNLVAV